MNDLASANCWVEHKTHQLTLPGDPTVQWLHASWRSSHTAAIMCHIIPTLGPEHHHERWSLGRGFPLPWGRAAVPFHEFFFWPHNVVKCGICYRKVCPSACLYVWHTPESRLNGSMYRNLLYTLWLWFFLIFCGQVWILDSPCEWVKERHSLYSNNKLILLAHSVESLLSALSDRLSGNSFQRRLKTNLFGE